MGDPRHGLKVRNSIRRTVLFHKYEPPFPTTFPLTAVMSPH